MAIFDIFWLFLKNYIWSLRKKAKLSENISVFQHLLQTQEPRVDYTHWNLKQENESSATFTFFLDAYELQLILGHSLPMTSSQIKHWAIRKVNLNIRKGTVGPNYQKILL